MSKGEVFCTWKRRSWGSLPQGSSPNCKLTGPEPFGLGKFLVTPRSLVTTSGVPTTPQRTATSRGGRLPTSHTSVSSYCPHMLEKQVIWHSHAPHGSRIPYTGVAFRASPFPSPSIAASSSLSRRSSIMWEPMFELKGYSRSCWSDRRGPLRQRRERPAGSSSVEPRPDLGPELVLAVRAPDDPVRWRAVPAVPEPILAEPPVGPRP